jgi:flagellin
MVSIISNVAAYSAQGNIEKANSSASSSIARLSSGNRIVKASDDVAGLSVGTILSTGVTTLKQALANASQGISLLQVADGALAQISDILTRQKAIATQANSGTLSDTDRSYLNQEFQALTAQIDQISGATSFSSVKLLDGSLSGAKSVASNTNVGTTAANSANVTSATIATITANVAASSTFTVNGVEITFAAATAGVGTTASAGKVIIGSSATATAQNVVNFLNTSTDARLANLRFTNTAGAINAVYIGGALDGTITVATSTSNTTNITGTGSSGTLAANANNLDGLGYGKTAALGAVTGSLFLNGDTTVTTLAGQALSTIAVVNNEDFVGKIGEGAISKISATYNGTTGTAVYSLTVGDVTYTSAGFINTSGALTLTGRDSTGALAGGSVVLNFRTASTGFSTYTSQAQLDPYIQQINDALSGVTFTQNRDITTFTAGAIATVDGIQVGTLQGASANFRSSDFSNVSLQSLNITAPTNGGTDAVITATINGQRYISVAGQGNQIDTNTSLVLQNLDDQTKAFTIQTGNTALTNVAGVAFDLSSQVKADAVAAALRAAFGFDGKSAALNLQVGAQASDTIGLQISNSNTTALFQGKTLDVTTTTGAQAASAAVDTALATVSASRATVGALQSRFNFTSANLQASITNQDAARSTLLDTDVSGESTAFSTAQVQLQAGIAVLAQANQLTQNLLKLIQ